MELAERLINQHHLAPPPAPPHALAASPGPLARLTRLEAVRPPLPGAAVALVTLGTARDEAAWVADRIRRLVAASELGPGPGVAGQLQGAEGKGGGGEAAARPLSLDDVAVLYRVNRQVGHWEGVVGAGVGVRVSLE